MREAGRLDHDQRHGEHRVGHPRVGQPHHRRQDRADDDERARAAPIDEPPGIGRQEQHRQPEHREGQADEVDTGSEAGQEQAPDDLVRAAREVPAGVDDEGRDQPAVPETERVRRGRLAGPDPGRGRP